MAVEHRHKLEEFGSIAACWLRASSGAPRLPRSTADSRDGSGGLAALAALLLVPSGRALTPLAHPGMNFKVPRDNTGDVDSYGGDATYSRDGCVLIVEDGRRQILYGPNSWICVEPDE